MKRIIVTGADGFIGRNLIRRLLSEDCKIYAIHRSHKKFLFAGEEKVFSLECDLDHIKDLKNIINENNIDVFFHLAWDGSTGAARGEYERQLRNVKYVCDAALTSKDMRCKRFVTTGTITENTVPDAIHNEYLSESLVYAIAKSAAHNMLNIICNKNNIDYCWARLSNIFGGDNRNGNLISYTLCEIKSGRVPEYGPCDQPYDFLYIKDAIEGIVKIGFAEECSNCYFVGSDRPRILREYIESIAQKFSANVGIGMKSSDGIVYREEWFDSSKLRKDMGFVPCYTFESAIDEIIRGE